MDHSPLVSVVMPVYNGASYLEEAIESVRRQTYSRWELVVVDNASTDETPAIATRFAADDDRIRLQSFTEFVGVLQNYNRAFGLISPEARYCKPLSSDDLLFPECLERMVGLADGHPEVGLVGALRLLGNTVDFYGFPPDVDVVAGADLCRAALLGGVWVFGSATSTMIRADMVRARTPFYNEQNIHADLESCYDVLGESSFGFVHQVLTYTRRHPASVTRQLANLMTHSVENIRIHERYGPHYLSQAEYERRLTALVFGHALEIARHADVLRSPEMRRYNRAALHELRWSIGLGGLARGFAAGARRSLSPSRETGATWLAARYATDGAPPA